MNRADKSLALVLTAGFLLRAAIRVWMGEEELVANGYAFYLRIAQTFVDGGGLCLAPGLQCSARVPGYALLLAPFQAAGWVYPGMVFVQAAIGTCTAWVAWAIGRELFDRRAGLIAACLTAFNPYAVVHDTALQDTSLLNFLLVLAVLLWLKLRKEASSLLAIAAGLSISLAVLTAARAALLLPAIFVWSWFHGGPTGPARRRHTTIAGMIVLVLVGGWTVRNWRIQGAWVLTTEFGRSLWIANNEWTFAHFPMRSIDRSAAESYRHLSDIQAHQLTLLGHDEVGVDRLQARWAVEEISGHPRRSLSYALRKVWVAASGELSPARSLVVQWSYALLFVPVHLLALAGMWLARDDWRTHALPYAILMSFMVTTAVFWAHTSHKSSVDPLLFVYAAAALPAMLPFVSQQAVTAQRTFSVQGSSGRA